MDPRKDQPASRVVEEPKPSYLPYLLVAFVAAVAVWGYTQQNFSGPAQRTNHGSPTRATRQTALQTTRSDVRTVFTTDDYPAEALRRNEQGTVQAELTIGVDGRVSGCRIVRSSGYSTLDNATCSILTRRARFSPARGANGRPVESHLIAPPVIWKLEG